MCDCDSGNCGMIGGLSSPAYNNPYNTIGVGDVRPAEINHYGSGDLMWNNCKKKRKKIDGISIKKSAPKDNGFVSQPVGGFGNRDLPLIVPVKTTN